MDMRKPLTTASKQTKAILTGPRFGQLAMLGVLLLGLQHDHTGQVVQSSLGTPAASTHTDLSNKPLLLSATVPIASAPSKRVFDTSYTVRILQEPFATSMSGARVPLTNFAAPSSQMAKAAMQYQFKPTLNQPLFKAVTSSPFAVGFGPKAKLAVWQQNSRYALIEQARKFVIILDPGHGGTDPGSVAHNGLQEKTLTLDIAKRAARLLSEDQDISVILTRNDDKGMSRQSRVHKVKKSQADMFVSLHLNHLPQTDVNLVETFYAAPHNILESIEKQRSTSTAGNMLKTAALANHDLAFTHGSKQLASIMQKRVFDEVINNNPQTDNAGVKEDTLYILTRSFTPGALIELSCLSNVDEAERLNDPAYRQKLASALVNGIRDYLTTPAAKRQFGMEV